MSGLWTDIQGFAGSPGLSFTGGLSAGGGFGPPTSGYPPTQKFNFTTGVLDAANFSASGGVNGTVYDSSGTLSYPPNNLNPNSILAGAVVGTPGTMPTGWGTYTALGISTQVVATGVDGPTGLPYVDIRFFGTNGNTYAVYAFMGVAAAVVDQLWESTVYAAIVGGSMINIQSIGNQVRGAPSGLGETPMTLSNTLKQQAPARLLLPAGVSTVVNAFILNMPTLSTAIDVTVRFASPQLTRVISTLSAPVPLVPTSGVAVYGNRFTSDPISKAALGVLVEEPRTNLAINNRLDGVGLGNVGTTATMPTGWNAWASDPVIACDIVGKGVENGVPYFDLRLHGTTTATGANLIFNNRVVPVFAAGVGVNFTSSAFFKLLAGTPPGAIFLVNIEAGSGAFPGYDIGIGPVLKRSAVSSVTSVGTTGVGVDMWVYGPTTAGTVVDFTFRFGCPQMEQAAFMTSPIMTGAAGVARTGDQIQLIGAAFNTAKATTGSILIGEVRSQPAAMVLAAQVDERIFVGSNARAFYSGGPNIVSAPAKNPGAPENIAIAWNPSGRSICATAGGIGTDAAVLWSTAPTALYLGYNPSLVQYLNGTIYGVAFWNTRLPDQILLDYIGSGVVA
jgi:hypothetical protein